MAEEQPPKEQEPELILPPREEPRRRRMYEPKIPPDFFRRSVDRYRAYQRERWK